MSTLYLLSALALLVAGANAYSVSKAADSAKVVCYFGSWATYRPGAGKFDVEQIDPMICTHLVFGFAGLGLDNKIYALDAYNEESENWGKGAYKRFTKLKLRNPSLKTILAIGGWNEGSEKYSRMASSPQSRRTFIDSVIPYLQKEGFDGLDLDWEYPTQRGGVPEDKANFAALCAELRQEFDKHGYLLTAAVSAGKVIIEEGYDVPSLAQSFDFISVMAYDFRGAWPHHPYTGHHAGFSAMPIEQGNDTFLNVKFAMEFWRDQGAPASKLIVGLPSYGRGFVLQDPTNTGFFSPSNVGIPKGPYTREDGFWGYNEICEEVKKGGWTTVRDENVVGVYSYKGNLWIGYDDPEAIRVKTEWLQANGFGGAMFWSLDTDDFQGNCGEPNILTKTAHRVLLGEVPQEPTTTVDPNLPPPTTEPPAPTPPSDGKCSQNGQTLGELCDTAFFVCNWNGNAWDMIPFSCCNSCIPPLYYDPAIRQCNWGEAIGCV